MNRAAGVDEAPQEDLTITCWLLARRRNSSRRKPSFSAAGRANVQRATNYVLGVVLFAAALFFAGMSTKLGNPRLQRVLLGFGIVVFLATVAWIATFPISFSV